MKAHGCTTLLPLRNLHGVRHHHGMKKWPWNSGWIHLGWFLVILGNITYHPMPCLPPVNVAILNQINLILNLFKQSYCNHTTERNPTHCMLEIYSPLGVSLLQWGRVMYICASRPTIIIPPKQRSCWGVYWFHSVRPSVCPPGQPSVPPAVSAL